MRRVVSLDRRPWFLLPLLLLLLLLAPSLPRAQGQDAPKPDRKPFGGPAAEEHFERVRMFDYRHLRLELSLDMEERSIAGTVTHIASPLYPGLRHLVLDCARTLTVSAVTLNGEPVEYTHEANELRVRLDRVYAPSEELELAVAYRGNPVQGLRFVVPGAEHPDRKMVVWTQGEPEDARYWVPCYDYPNERMTAELIVTVAKPYSVVSNGTLLSVASNGPDSRTYHWKLDQELPSYLLTLTAAEFNRFQDRLGDLPIDYYVLKEVDEETTRRVLGATPRMIAFFNEKIGTPYAYPSYAQVCLPEFNGGMEHTSATTLGDEILVDATAYLENNSDSLVAHELAHQWFGDLVTCRDWSNLWLNEGFASYFDSLFAEHDRGEDTFRHLMMREFSTYLMSESQYQRPIVESKYQDAWQLFDSVTYAKGSCVLHALRGLVGDEAWWKGIRGYVASHKDGTVVTSDFQAAMEEAAGRDLTWFFDQWVYQAGHPALEARWRYEPEDRTIRLTVRQVQQVDENVPLFRLPTTVEITDESGTRSIPVVFDSERHDLIIPAPTEPSMVLIDPLGWIPMTIDFDKGVTEWLYQLNHAASYPGRLQAATVLATNPEFREDPIVRKALSESWKKENAPLPRREMLHLAIQARPESADYLKEAAQDADPLVRTEAVRGLMRQGSGTDRKARLLEIYQDRSQTYGARLFAFTPLLSMTTGDERDKLISEALTDPSSNHAFALAALRFRLNQRDSRSREAAVVFSQPGQPTPLRIAAIRELARRAKKDPEAVRIVESYFDDRLARVRSAAALGLAQNGVESALEPLRRVLPETEGSMRPILAQLIARLEGGDESHPPRPSSEESEADKLDRQADELELRLRETRNKAEALRISVLKSRMQTDDDELPED